MTQLVHVLGDARTSAAAAVGTVGIAIVVAGTVPMVAVAGIAVSMIVVVVVVAPPPPAQNLRWYHDGFGYS